MMFEGPRAYFKSIWSYVDFFGMATYWVYVGACLLNHINEKEEDFNSPAQIYMMTIIIVCLFIKNCFYIRIFNTFALLVNLVQTCLVDILPFCAFLAFWLYCYYLLFLVTGIKSPDRDVLGSY